MQSLAFSRLCGLLFDPGEKAADFEKHEVRATSNPEFGILDPNRESLKRNDWMR
jgi:hypothetical protein